ncbi:low specificity L-threonine aldolase [Kaistia dalseonensis]|nr:low specificity L-threonine aldolase [Kaistia dalseonensis]
MNFASDNWAGASDRVAAALVGAAGGHAPAYGNDPLSEGVTEALSRIFERRVAVFFVGTGTAANALSLAHVARPGGVVFCHRHAHIANDEAGAPEFLSGGSRLHSIEGTGARVTADGLAEAIALYPPHAVFHGQPAAVSISQLTEAGTAYSAAEIAALADVAHEAGLPLHMDGARFANALVGLGARPADITWRAGVDMLSFGGTKNGCFAAEAVIFFDPEKARGFEFQRKRAGHLFSKSRFVSAQFSAYLEDDHWLDLARHANATARRLADGIEQSPGAHLALQPDGNEVFAILPRAVDARLKAAGAVYYEWHAGNLAGEAVAPDELLVRLVTSFRTTDVEVDRFVGLLTQ